MGSSITCSAGTASCRATTIAGRRARRTCSGRCPPTRQIKKLLPSRGARR
nr:MAG TPA: hypothetical protein [Caudoviricetes sp.]